MLLRESKEIDFLTRDPSMTDVVNQLRNGSLCWGIEVIGLNNAIDTFNEFSKHYRLDCVSVGSGLAVFESDCLKSNKETTFHLVDPDYLCFARARIPNASEMKEIMRIVKSFAKKPDYPLVKDLVKEKGHLVSNSVMLLNWCNYGKDYYDYDAIRLMKPVAIFVIYAHANDLVVGAAGSFKFHLFCNHVTGRYTTLKRPFIMSAKEDEEIKALSLEYKLIHSCSSEVTFKKVPMIVRMSWLERRDRPIIFRKPETSHLLIKGNGNSSPL